MINSVMSSRCGVSSLLVRILPYLRSVTEISEKRAVGKPQMLSRLRFVNIIQRQDETQAEKLYRSENEALQRWNNEYWSENNARFVREKQEYIDNLGQGHKNSSDDQGIFTHDQLAPFYRDFLERNLSRNIEYNKVWYKLHTRLLFSALKAKYSRIAHFVTSDDSVNEDRRIDGSLNQSGVDTVLSESRSKALEEKQEK